MAEHLVVCIARQFGSGGREIGARLAQGLGATFYDKELLKEAADKSGILQEMLEKADEKPAGPIVRDPIAGDKAPTYADYLGYLPNDRVQDAIADAIRAAADKGPCVIIGRCADYILRGRPRTLSVFVHADLDLRIQRIRRLHNLEEDAARSLIRKTDRSRANYYSYYTDRDWSAASNYHLCVDAGRFSIAGAVDIITKAAAAL